jgi:hypothetical protein
MEMNSPSGRKVARYGKENSDGLKSSATVLLRPYVRLNRVTTYVAR